MIKSNKIKAILTLSTLGLLLTYASLAGFTLVDEAEKSATNPKTSGYWDLTGALISIDNNWRARRSTVAN